MRRWVAHSDRVAVRVGLAEPDRRDAWLAIDGVGPNNVDPLREVFAELLGA